MKGNGSEKVRFLSTENTLVNRHVMKIYLLKGTFSAILLSYLLCTL